jgi:hypothetical protein
MHQTKWFRIAMFNLALLSGVGFILRYKIVLSFPWLDQKHLLHAHSHFAFTGWITQALMVMILKKSGMDKNHYHQRKFNILLTCNLIAAYGMLIAFTQQGYAALSITFSTISILILTLFTIQYFKSAHQTFIKSVQGELVSAGLIYGVLSSFGAFALGFLMMTKNMDNQIHLMAVYFFLHFQYNGFFILTCSAFFIDMLSKLGIVLRHEKTMIRLLIFSVFPAYFLSALWIKIPIYIYLLVIASAMSQFFVFGKYVAISWKNRELIKQQHPSFARRVLLLATIALALKLILQMGSTIPSLSNWAYGYRPIVIGYLHLVLLGVITLSILGMAIQWGWIQLNRVTKIGMIVFISGLILNELALFIQGISSIILFEATYTGNWLLLASFMMMLGLSTLFIGNKFRSLEPDS